MSTFQELGLNPKLNKALDALGFVEPTEIQKLAIPEILADNQDVIALAQTGTGKTAAFGLPTVEQVDSDNRFVQTIILSPTRELALQIAKDLESFAAFSPKIKITAVYGGTNISAQIKTLKSGVHIVVGTPGRTLDLIRRKVLKINEVKTVVLDEADEMLNMGFREDLDLILKHTPAEKQTLLFSATMPSGVREIASNYMTTPKEISVGHKNTGSKNVEHHYYVVRSPDRYLALKRLADANPDIYAIIFCRTRRETKEVANNLMKDGYNADALHGDLSQAQRDYVMNRFRDKQLQLLVATDVAARGIDVDVLTHVLNYNLPDDPEVYIHRSGRTGRAGNKGISIVITHSRERRKLQSIERLLKKQFELKQIPSGEDICEKRLYSLMDKIEQIEVDEEQIHPYMEAITEKLAWLSREELLKRFVSVEFNQFLNYYKDAKNLNVSDRGSRRDEPKSFNRPSKFARLKINMGAKQDLTVPRLIGLVNDYTRTTDIAIGKVDIQRNFSFFGIDEEAVDLVKKAFQRAKFRGQDIVLEVARGGGRSSFERRDSSPTRKGGRGNRRFSKSKSGGYSGHRKGGKRNKRSKFNNAK